MSDIKTDFIEVDGASIAVRFRKGSKTPGLMWLGGYRSDMLGTKAVALDEWAAANDHGALRLDYSGHGESGGDFNQGTISRWLAESLAVYRKYADGPLILVGSSMGGWIALLMAQQLLKEGTPVDGLVLIAPAPDFTALLVEPSLNEDQKRQLQEQGYFELPSEYSPNPYVYTRALLEDGRNHLLMDGLVETGCAVHILQGMLDEDVPYHYALALLECLPVDDVTLTLVRDGDHRLSRPQDIDLLTRTISGLIDQVAKEQLYPEA